MGWLYILKSSNRRYYIGSTKDWKRRLKQHIRGYTRTSRVLRTYQLVYLKEFGTIQEARLREKKLKSYKSKKYIEWLIANAPVAQWTEQLPSKE